MQDARTLSPTAPLPGPRSLGAASLGHGGRGEGAPCGPFTGVTPGTSCPLPEGRWESETYPHFRKPFRNEVGFSVLAFFKCLK